MSRKHAVLEQIDGNIEQPQEIDTEYDKEIEDYLKTGILGSESQLFEDLLFYLKRRKDKLEALEARRQALEREYGMGSYLEMYPWSYPKDYREGMFDDET